MSRVKTFDSTGTPPGGRLFAGDLNSIQDQYADLSNFSQTHDVGTLRVGDTSIQLLKYGTAEARISAALRTDGILRGLGGLFAGQFTTAGRPGLGSRPFGLVIYNTDLNRLEMNIGSDASPNWVAIGLDAPTVPIGAIADYGGASDPSASWLLCDGRAISRTTYAALFTALGGAGTPYGIGDGSTTFNIPDFRGRVAVAPDAGTNRIPNSPNARGNAGGEEMHVLSAAELPSHAHSMTHEHTLTMANTPAADGVSFPVGGAGSTRDVGGAGVPIKYLSGNTGGAGSGSSHNNMQPYEIANRIIRVL
jgi:microcystin-dependent protein